MLELMANAQSICGVKASNEFGIFGTLSHFDRMRWTEIEWSREIKKK